MKIELSDGEKYRWLISKLKLKDIDLRERDALIVMSPLYIQLSRDGVMRIDQYIEELMTEEIDALSYKKES